MLTAFIESVEDLRTRSSVMATSYDVTQAAGITRRLLLDGRPLAVSARTFLRCDPPVYTWTRDMYTGWDGEVGWGYIVSGHNFDPALATAVLPAEHCSPSPSLTSGGVSDLLAARVVESGSDADQHLTVRDFVSWLASDEGGVHFAMFNDSARRERLVHAMDTTPSHIRWTMIAIGRVVARGLEPLVLDAVRRLGLVVHY